MNKKLSIGVVAILLVGIGFFVLTRQNSQQATQGSQILNNCVSDKGEILAVVNTFETLQKNKDSKGVLGLFTPAQSQEEISDYQNLSGENPQVGSPRLYNNISTNYNTQSYKVVQEPTKSADNFCDVMVEEQRSIYGGPINPQYSPAQTRGFALTLTKQNGEWKIDQYQSQDIRIKKGKYIGFFNNTDNYNKAVQILQVIPEIQTIQNAVIKNGRNISFSSAGGENGDIVTVLLFEEGFPDQHTTRIDTFMVNVKTNEVQVYTAASVPNKNLSLEDWKKTVKERFE